MTSNRSSLLTVSITILALTMTTLACNVSDSTAPPTITAVVIPTATASPRPLVVSATPAVVPLPTAAATASPTPAQTAMPVARTKDKTNIYSGPGVNYPLLGTLSAGLAVKLIGRNADQSWLQIEFPAAPDGFAWALASNLDLSAAANVGALPVVNAPPAPARSPAPTRAFTPQPTATVAGLISVLRADKTQLTAGECTTLRWDVENVQAVFLNSGSGDQPVAGHGTLWICPDATTTFALLVVNKDNTTQKHTATVAVSSCGDTPVISRFEASALEVKAGTRVTFVWDVSCAQGVYFKAGTSERQPVAGHDQIEVEVKQTTLFRLVVVAKNGSEIKRDITIQVTP